MGRVETAPASERASHILQILSPEDQGYREVARRSGLCECVCGGGALGLIRSFMWEGTRTAAWCLIYD